MSRARRKKEGLTRLLAWPGCVARSRPSARPGKTLARALFAATGLLVAAGAPPDGGMELTVTDDGAGFDPGAARGGGGLGLESMEERVRYARARFQLTSHPGTGTEVRV